MTPTLTDILSVRGALSSLFLGLTTLAIGCVNPPTDEDVLSPSAQAEEEALTGSAFTCDGRPQENHAGVHQGPLRQVRAAAHPEGGFNRFVMQFKAGTNPRNYIVRRSNTNSFSGTCEPPECPVVNVAGEGALAVIFMNGVGDDGYTGSGRVRFANAKGIKEAAIYDQFEANVEWALGTQKNPCFRTWTLTNPPRLIVDVKR